MARSKRDGKTFKRRKAIARFINSYTEMYNSMVIRDKRSEHNEANKQHD